MNPIEFPGLGLSFRIRPVAFTVFGWSVYWYGIIIALAFVVGVFYCYRNAARFGISPDRVIDMILFAGPGGIIGARIYYVFFNQSVYRNADGSFNWGRAVAVWDGGLAIYGGIIVAVLILLIFCRVTKINFPAFTDLCAYGLFIGQAIGRWGNFINREAYGSATTLPWRMGLTVSGTYIEVHPIFFYECLWNLVGFVIARFVLQKRRRFDGQIFLFYLTWYGLGRAWIEALRNDKLYLFGTGILVNQLVAVICLVGAGLALVLLTIRLKPDPKRLYVNRMAAEKTTAKAEETVPSDASLETPAAEESSEQSEPKTAKGENDDGSDS